MAGLKRKILTIADKTDPSEGELEICPLCQFSSVKLEAFLLHCTMVHMNKEKYECTLCHFSSSAKFVFLSHIRIHLEILLQDLEKRRIDGYFYCDKCEFKCIDVRQLFLHHHYKIFWCLCGSVFHNRADYITHKCFPKPGKIRDVTNHENFQGIDFVLSHKCPHCQFRSMSRTGLMKHQLIHYKVSFHQCHICNFTCMTEFTMINHLAQVHNYEQNRAIEEVRKINKEYMCYICESMFECSDDLKNHIISHTYEFSQFRQNQAYDAICPISKNSSAGETLEGDTETTSDKDFIQKEMQRNLVSLTDANLWQIPKLVEDYMNDVGMLVEYDLAQRDTNEDPSNYLGNKESCLHESELNNIEVPLKISNGPAEEMKNLKLKTSTEEGQALILQNPQVVESQSNENESYYVVDINESEIVLCNMDAINSNYENEEHLGYKIIPNVENFQKENEITEHENVNAINGALQHPKDYLHEVEGEICLGNETVHHSEDDLRVQEISAKYKTLQDIDHLYKQKGESDTEVGETLLHQKDCLPEQEAESKSVHHTKDYISEENEGFGSENEPSRYHTGQLHKKGGEINTEIEKSCDGKDYLHECKVECYTESETKLHSQVYLKEQKDEIDAENETLQCHEHNLHLEKGEISAEIETLKDQKKYLHEQKGENDAENETLQHPKHYLQEEKGDSIEEIETLQDEKDLHEENGEIGDERETLPPPKHYLQEEKGDSNSEIETLQDQKDLCEENVEIGEERETLLPRKHYLQEEKGDSNVEIETLQDEKDLHEENGEIGDERETLPPPKHYLQEEKGDSNAEIETLQDEKVLREENVEIGDERETLPPPKHYLQEEKGDSNAEIETLQDEKDLREENGEIGDERETLPHPKHYLQEEKGDSNAVIETLQDEKDLCEENGEIGDERETLPPRKHYLHEEIDAENETVHLPINLCEQTSEICVENETLLHPKHYLTDQNPGIDAENETLQLSKDSYEQAGNIGAEKETLIQPFYLCKVDDENKIILYTDPENETASLQNKNGRVENLETSFYHR